MKLTPLLSALLVLLFVSCKTQKNAMAYQSDNLKIERLSKNTYRHITYLSTTDYGKVACNGMIVIDQGEALIFDTPTNDKTSNELIGWVKTGLKCKTVGVIVTHFHQDCLGGLQEFHAKQIPSYASNKTIELATKNNYKIPQTGFENYLEIKVGNKKVINEFLGEGHTIDNIVSYFPDEKALFGGCLIKSLNAGKGYLGDANITEWSNTVNAIKSKYPNLKIVIPGHGKPGNTDLLNYTIAMFKEEQ